MGKSNEGTGERVRRKGVGEWEGMGEKMRREWRRYG